MGIVAAGVHDAWVRGGKREVGLLCDGQRVKFRSEGDVAGVGIGADKCGKNAFATDVTAVGDAHVIQARGNEVSGEVFLMREFGDGVEVMVCVGDKVENGVNLLSDLLRR